MIYLASPYTHIDPNVMHARFLNAQEIVVRATRAGHHIISPIVHFHQIACDFELPRDFTFWQNYNLELLSHCSQLWVLQSSGWRSSVGVAAEIAHAEQLGIPIVYITQGAILGTDYQHG